MIEDTPEKKESTLGDRIKAAEILHEDMLLDLFSGLEFFRRMAGPGINAISITDNDGGGKWTCTFQKENP